jgi:hypothetical protein
MLADACRIMLGLVRQLRPLLGELEPTISF